MRLGPFVLKPIEPFDTVKKSEGFGKKFKIDLDVYSELGLAGQITEKFLELPYRSGKIEFESGKLAGKGLVCSSFAKIFGALWFAGDPTKQEKPKAHTMRADVRPRRAYEFGKEWKIVHKGSGMVIGESDSEKKAKERARLRTVSKDAGKTVSSAQVYAAQYNGWLVNVKRLRLRKLIEKLDKKRLYAVVKYGGRTGDNREHVLFLIYANSLSDWVMIHSTGWGRKTGGKGPGPGIYEIPPKGYKSRKFYQAWDWGWAYRPRNPDIERWKYVP